MGERVITGWDPATGESVTVIATVECTSTSPGKVRIISIDTLGTATDMTARAKLFKDNFMKAIEGTANVLKDMIPRVYLNARILQNYNLGLPHWYSRFVWKYFRWMM